MHDKEIASIQNIGAFTLEVSEYGRAREKKKSYLPNAEQTRPYQKTASTRQMGGTSALSKSLLQAETDDG